MSRWVARIVGLLLLIVFIVLMVHLQNQLEGLQQRRSGSSTTTTTESSTRRKITAWT
jgi:hypothetical protein